MPKTREEILEETRQLKAEYGELFDSITTFVFRHDRIGINFEVNPDEYQYETGTILTRLRTCESSTDVRRVVHEEFCRWLVAIPQVRSSGIPRSRTIFGSYGNVDSGRDRTGGGLSVLA